MSEPMIATKARGRLICEPTRSVPAKREDLHRDWLRRIVARLAQLRAGGAPTPRR